jgi:uncharacterized protein
MDKNTIDEVYQLNPWLESGKSSDISVMKDEDFISRVQTKEIVNPDWDSVWTILIGPRRAGKTTLGKYLSLKYVTEGRFSNLLYLNCDYLSIRNWLKTPLFISEAIKEFNLDSPVLFIDEVQRLESPGLLLKAIVDLNLPIKLIATGSSQLEIKSKVQEHLTGRNLTSLILPFSYFEWIKLNKLEDVLVYGCYPQVLKSSRKEIQLREIYQRYIQKDIVEFLKVGSPDVFDTLATLIAHSSGQLVNYQQLATDCGVSVTMIRNYLNILEQTFVISKITPFVGNKRSEVTSNPVYYFIDNGFRNIAIRNFSQLSARSDLGLLVEGFVFQEILKFKSQNYYDFDIHYWRTKSGAEVDFVLYKSLQLFIPVEVKYRQLNKPSLTRSFRSFITAYNCSQAIVITKNLVDEVKVENCTIYFIPLTKLDRFFEKLILILEL